MEDTDTVVYDVEEAAKTVAERTKKKLDLVEEILEAEFMFNAAMGFYEIPDDEEGEEFQEELRRLREDNSDIFPPSDMCADDCEDLEDRVVAFIARITGSESEIIEDVLDAHILYLEEKGLLEPLDEE